MPSLKFRMALPIPLPSSGSRFAPKITITMTRITSNSGMPIRLMGQLLTLPSARERRADGRRDPRDCTTRARKRGIPHLVVFLIIAVIFPLEIGSLAARQFASGVDLVEVYATVTDARGEPVTGLTAADFQVIEDGAPQAIAAFAAGEFPLAVAVAIDRSFSMRSRLAESKNAARSFVAALRPDDRVMIVAIGSETEIVSPLTIDHAAAMTAIARLDAWGTTPLYDAVLAAVDDIQNAKGRRALVVLSDGVDRYSETTAT